LIPRDKLRALARRSGQTNATIWLGKQGITPQLLNQIDNQLKSRELVKVKVQKSLAADVTIEDVASKIAKDTGSTLVNVRGRTFSLFRSRKKHRNDREHRA
jgi:putative YhbY family RNA-binding protein